MAHLNQTLWFGNGVIFANLSEAEGGVTSKRSCWRRQRLVDHASGADGGRQCRVIFRGERPEITCGNFAREFLDLLTVRHVEARNHKTTGAGPIRGTQRVTGPAVRLEVDREKRRPGSPSWQHGSRRFTR